MSAVRIVLALIRGIIADRAELAAENLALRQQLAAPRERTKRPQLRKRDRILWVWLSPLWSGWRACLLSFTRQKL